MIFLSIQDSAAKMVRKKIDNRIRVLIENNVKTRMRSFFVVVGDKDKDQVSDRLFFKYKYKIHVD